MGEQVSLSSYTSIKLRLASVLQNLLRFAQEQKDEDRARLIRELLADLAENTFRLALSGLRSQISAPNRILSANEVRQSRLSSR
jgi:hypothetical protein